MSGSGQKLSATKMKVKLSSASKRESAAAEESKGPDDDATLSMLVSGLSQETKKKEATRFDEANSQTLKKMQDLQAMIKNSKPNTEADDFENDDEFDNYMEEHLM